MLLTDLLDELPPELILHILPVRDLARLTMASHACKARCSEPLKEALEEETRRQISGRATRRETQLMAMRLTRAACARMQ